MTATIPVDKSAQPQSEPNPELSSRCLGRVWKLLSKKPMSVEEMLIRKQLLHMIFRSNL